MKKLAVVLMIVAVMVLTFSFSAGACTATGKIKYVVANAGGVNIYVTPYTTSPFVSTLYYYFIPNSQPGLMSAAETANVKNSAVQVQSTLTCPTTGTVRYGGNPSAIYIFDNL